MKIGNKLLNLRKAKALSQQELSKITGISQTYISKLEDNQREPTIGKALVLANALGVTVSELLDEDANF